MRNKNKTIKLTLNDVFHLARLAQLRLKDKEVEKYQRQLEETLKYVDNLNELNTDMVKESLYLNSKNVFFEDGKKNERSLNANDLSNNKKTSKNYFSVKRIL